MKKKVSELSGAALDWAVAKCEGKHNDCQILAGNVWYGRETSGFVQYRPSTNWSQGGPIIEREGITVSSLYAQTDSPIKEFELGEWGAYIPSGTESRSNGAGPTPLIAAMRCHVVSKLGEEVEIPEDLI